MHARRCKKGPKHEALFIVCNVERHCSFGCRYMCTCIHAHIRTDKPTCCMCALITAGLTDQRVCHVGGHHDHWVGWARTIILTLMHSWIVPLSAHHPILWHAVGTQLFVHVICSEKSHLIQYQCTQAPVQWTIRLSAYQRTLAPLPCSFGASGTSGGATPISTCPTASETTISAPKASKRIVSVGCVLSRCEFCILGAPK